MELLPRCLDLIASVERVPARMEKMEATMRPLTCVRVPSPFPICTHAAASIRGAMLRNGRAWLPVLEVARCEPHTRLSMLPVRVLL
jgi:hypothetical protein